MTQLGQMQELNGGRTQATLAVNQEDGRVCYAEGILEFTPANVGQFGLAQFRLGTTDEEPLDCYFSDVNVTGPGGASNPVQSFDASQSRKLRLSLSQSVAGLELRMTLDGEKSVSVPVVEQADLYSGSGPSIHNEALAGYVLSLRQYQWGDIGVPKPHG